MSRKMRNYKGFTLIEIVVVVAIIGILAALAIPNYMGARKKAGSRAIKLAAVGIRGELHNWMLVVKAQKDDTIDFDGDGDVDAADDTARPETIAGIPAQWDTAYGPDGTNEYSPYGDADKDGSKDHLFDRTAAAGDGQIAIACGDSVCTVSVYTNVADEGVYYQTQVSVE